MADESAIVGAHGVGRVRGRASAIGGASCRWYRKSHVSQSSQRWGG
jgi:hypothetical protein